MLWNPQRSLKGQIVALVVVMLSLEGAAATAIETWDERTGASTQRFQVLDEYRGEAVLDQETSLIWERLPSPTGTVWAEAPLRCALKSVGGRKGWRLPSFLELMTLIEPRLGEVRSEPTLPGRHPFQGVNAERYWSVTSLSANARNAYAVDFLIGDVASQRKSYVSYYWCVRGGSSGSDDPRHPRQSGEVV